MGSGTSGMHKAYVVARARKLVTDAVLGSAGDSMHSEHAASSADGLASHELVMEKIDKVLGHVLLENATKKAERLPCSYCGEDALEVECCREALVDIVPSRRYLCDNTLFFCSQSIVEMTPYICKLKTLRILQACCNSMSRLPTQIGLLKNLRSLVLSNNQISSLPEDIGECTNLNEIYLSHNHLENLPMTFVKLSKLEVLDIAANRLKSIPMCVAELESLRYLNIEGNCVKAVPIEILRLKKLKKLSFHGNPLVFIEGIDASTSMASLRELCARKVFGTRSSVNCIEALSSFVSTAKKCSFCGGPYYEREYVYTDAQATIFGLLPVYYRLCSRHFDTKKGKIEKALSMENPL